MVGSSERFNVDFEWNMQFTIIQGEKVILPNQKWQPVSTATGIFSNYIIISYLIDGVFLASSKYG